MSLPGGFQLGLVAASPMYSCPPPRPLSEPIGLWKRGTPGGSFGLLWVSSEEVLPRGDSGEHFSGGLAGIFTVKQNKEARSPGITQKFSEKDGRESGWENQCRLPASPPQDPSTRPGAASRCHGTPRDRHRLHCRRARR